MEGSQWVVAFGLGCPVEHAGAVAAGAVACGVYELGHEGFACLGAACLIACLHYHHWATVFPGQGVYVLYHALEGLVLALGEARLHVPVGVDAHAYHVILRMVFLEAVEDGVVAVDVAGSVEVDDAGGIGVHPLGGAIACLGEAGILAHVLGRVRHGPQEAVGGLVSYLYPLHVDASRLEQLEGAGGVACQGAFHLAVVVVFPLGGDVLLAWVGPPVAVVEVDHYRHALVLGAASHGKHVVHVAQAVLGVYPHAESRRVEAQLSHEGDVVALLASLVIQLHAAALEFARAADVGTEPEFLCPRGHAEKAKKQG